MLQRINVQYLFPVILLCTLCLSVNGQIKRYRQLPAAELPLSSRFSVEVRQGTGPFQSIYVYQHNTDNEKTITKTEHWTAFGFEPKKGPVTVRITRKDGRKLTAGDVELVNKTYKDASTQFSGDALLITLSQSKKQFYVRVKGEEENPLMIFADPLHESTIPKKAKVVRFKASDKPYIISDSLDRFTIPDDADVVYLEDGALIKGNIHTSKTRKKPVRLMGHGVVMGNGPVIHGPKGIPFNSVVLTTGVGNVLEGIIVMKSRHFGVDMGKQSHVDNVKMFGYETNNDGISAGDHSLIENTFFKVNDDHVKLYHDNIVVRNCVFYIQWNGAVFQFAWNKIKPGSNCVVEDCEIIATEHDNSGDPALGQGGIAHTLISLRESSSRPSSGNNLFRNIYVQGQLLRLIGVNAKYGISKPLSLQNIRLENITLAAKPKQESWLYNGEGPDAISFRFKNVTAGGECLTKSEFKTEGNVELNFDCK